MKKNCTDVYGQTKPKRKVSLHTCFGDDELPMVDGEVAKMVELSVWFESHDVVSITDHQSTMTERN